MKKQLISAGLPAILAIAQPANAALIMDTYIGGDGHGYGDVIGDSNIFGVDGMDVEMLAKATRVNSAPPHKVEKALVTATCS